MKSEFSITRKILTVGILVLVGSALLYFGHSLVPSIFDRSVSMSEFRSRSRLGSAIDTFGFVALALAASIWIGYRPRHRRRHPSPQADGRRDNQDLH